MLQTYELSTTVFNPNGTPAAGSILIAELTTADYTTEGSIMPRRAQAVADSEGRVAVDLFSNLSGTQNSFYEIRIRRPDGFETIKALIQMPQADSKLEGLVDVTPITPEYSTAAAISAAQALESRNIAVAAAEQATDAIDIILPAAEAAIEAADSVMGSDRRINTLFWLGV